MAIIPQTRYETSLTDSITATDTTIPVATCPASGVTSGFVRIEDEIIKFEGNSNPGGAGNLTSCTRGLALSGTSEADAGLGVAHQAGKKVLMSNIHYYMNNAGEGNILVSELGDTTITSIADNDILAYDSGSSAWLNQSASEAGVLANVVEDTTPQLGGDLDLNGNNIDFPTTANISDCLDEDNMASNSATALATQQSIKAYVDNFTGSSNIVTVGTLASGDATAVVTAATDSSAGKVELATDAEALTGTDTGRVVTPGNLGAITIRKYKSSDQTVNNSITKVNDDTLFFPIGANETWAFMLYVVLNSGATPDFAYKFDAPTGATMAWGDTSTTPDNLRTETSDLFTTTTGSNQAIFFTGTATSSSTTGNIQFTWAQSLADASDTKVLTGSYLIAHKLA